MTDIYTETRRHRTTGGLASNLSNTTPIIKLQQQIETNSEMKNIEWAVLQAIKWMQDNTQQRLIMLEMDNYFLQRLNNGDQATTEPK